MCTFRIIRDITDGICRKTFFLILFRKIGLNSEQVQVLTASFFTKKQAKKKQFVRTIINKQGGVVNSLI